MEEDDEALAAPGRGDERRAVREARPGLLGEARLGLRKHLPRDSHFVRNRQPEERAALVERRDMSRRVPRQRAAQSPAAPSQRRRRQAVAAGGETGPCEPDEDAAIVEKALDRIQ